MGSSRTRHPRLLLYGPDGAKDSAHPTSAILMREPWGGGGTRFRRAFRLSQEPSPSARKCAFIFKMHRRTESHRTPSSIVVAGIALLGPALGVATELWPQAIMLLGLGVFLIVSPPRRSPGPIWISLLAAIGALSLPAFLPVRWLGVPAWRRTLESGFPVELPQTVSPQPWLTCHAALLLFAGLVFAFCVLAQPWRSENRRTAIRLYVAGVTIVAAVAIVSALSGHRVPFWPVVLNSAQKFGFFPNRNQTGNVLALAAILSTALAFESFGQRRKAAWWWAAAVIVLGVAAVMAYSRAGILLFFGGIAAWLLVSAFASAPGKGAALGAAGFALALALFFLLGGETLERFQRSAQGPRPDFRFFIHADALRLSLTAPWFGQGLGNFEPVFAMLRGVSADQNRVLHPESDWLWVAVEMGWPATLLIAGAFFLCLKQCFPFSRGSDRAMRSAAAVCAVAFALHALADVSGHRPGSAWPAIFLAGLALHPDRRLDERRWVAPVSRFLGLLLVLVACWWLVSLRSEAWDRAAPTPATIDRISGRIDRAIASRDYSAANKDINELLRIQPLDYDLYYRRGVARVAEAFSAHGAERNFETARFLQPHLVALCVAEGRVWLSVDQQERGLGAWEEALRRAGADAPVIYDRMLGDSDRKFSTHNGLRRLARMNPDYFIAFLRHADRIECDLEIGAFLDEEPNLDPLSHVQRRKFFSAWFQKGDRSLLISRLLAEPAWQEDGWPSLAQAFARERNFEQAYRTALRFGTAPALPHPATGKPLPELERAFHSHPEDFQAGLDFFLAQREAGQTAAALETLDALEKIPRHPAYLAFIESQLRAEREEWEKAWNAWWRFAGGDFR